MEVSSLQGWTNITFPLLASPAIGDNYIQWKEGREQSEKVD